MMVFLEPVFPSIPATPGSGRRRAVLAAKGSEQHINSTVCAAPCRGTHTHSTHAHCERPALTIPSGNGITAIARREDYEGTHA